MKNRRDVLRTASGIGLGTLSITASAAASSNSEGVNARFSFDPNPPEGSEEITFDASESSSSFGEIEEYQWVYAKSEDDVVEEWLDDEDTYFGTGQVLTRSFAADTTWDVGVKVVDEEGNSDTYIESEIDFPEQVELDVTIEVEPDPAEGGEEVTFDASESSSPRGEIEEYQWVYAKSEDDVVEEWLDDEETYFGTGEVLTRSFAADTTWDVGVKVIDEDGRTGRAIERELEFPKELELDATFEYEPASPEDGEEITFDASESSSPRGEIEEYQWVYARSEDNVVEDWLEDGTYFETGEVMTNSFIGDTTWDVGLKIIDDEGFEGYHYEYNIHIFK